MLSENVTLHPLYSLVNETAEGLGLKVVAVNQINKPGEKHVEITVYNPREDTSVQDCESLHKALQGSLEIMLGKEELSMTVSTPGLTRSFADYHEFDVFSGKRCAFYSNAHSAWIRAVIEKTENSKVYFTDCSSEEADVPEEMVEDYKDIQKAKLDYKWEDKNVRIK